MKEKSMKVKYTLKVKCNLIAFHFCSSESLNNKYFNKNKNQIL